MLDKPFHRIFRENIQGSNSDEYLNDTEFANSKMSFIHSYHLIEKDIKELFDYISPHCLNQHTFSHRLYELFFRVCTEFENNAKAILEENGYSLKKRPNIENDYFRINDALQLDKYSIKLSVWEPAPAILRPFVLWDGRNDSGRTIYSPLPWYQDYNKVKHNRTNNFHFANLKNLINAAAGLLAILYAQFGDHSFSPYQPISMIDSNNEFISANDCIFHIKPFNWPDKDKYSFNWNSLKSLSYRFNNFPFKP